ncbi:MAG: hypothetical protein ACLVGX_02370, partial [Oscillospiraceae bacterium]
RNVISAKSMAPTRHHRVGAFFPHHEGLRIAPKTGIIGGKDKRTDCQKTAKPKVSEGRKE